MYSSFSIMSYNYKTIKVFPIKGDYFIELGTYYGNLLIYIVTPENNIDDVLKPDDFLRYVRLFHSPRWDKIRENKEVIEEIKLIIALYQMEKLKL